jgi:hypothetical protein
VVHGHRNLSAFVFCLVLTSAAASAEAFGEREIYLSSGDDERLVSFLSGGEMTGDRAAWMDGSAFTHERIDYSTFAYELIAFVAKEAFSDSDDEYPGSPLGSRLSRDMTVKNSPFGKHCLVVVSQVGRLMPSSLSGLAFARPGGVDDVLRVASTALALRRIWTAFKSDVEGDRRGFSLKPKVGARRVGVNVTFHW